MKHRRYCGKCKTRKWREKYPILACFTNLKTNAKRRGKDFRLDFEYFVKFVVDTSYIKRKGTGRDDLTIDRKVGSKGYERGNLQVLPNHENVRKARREKESWQPGKQTAQEAGTPF